MMCLHVLVVVVVVVVVAAGGGAADVDETKIFVNHLEKKCRINGTKIFCSLISHLLLMLFDKKVHNKRFKKRALQNIKSATSSYPFCSSPYFSFSTSSSCYK